MTETEVRYACGNDGRDWQPLPEVWSDRRVTAGELMWAMVHRRISEQHRPTILDRHLSQGQRVGLNLRNSEQRLRDTTTTERIRWRGDK